MNDIETKSTTGFRKYDHLEKQGHRNTRGIEEGKCYVFPKIDGTNACVWSDGTTVFAGSRKRQLELGEDGDNAGFYAWVMSDDPKATALRHLALANPDLILYGEWLVPHTLKTYHPEAWRRFWIFDVFHRSEEERFYLDFETYSAILDPTGVDYIDPLAIYNNATGAQLKGETEGNDFLIMEGQGVGEGVVIKNYEWRREGSHDRVWGKFVRSEFKVSHRRTMGAPEKEGRTEVERVIAEQFVTPTLVEKNLAKVCLIVSDSEPNGNAMEREELLSTFRGRIIPQLLGRVWNDLIDEEMWNILKKHKGATIDFKRLQALATVQIKTILPDLFA
jgi:hypothetical protein